MFLQLRLETQNLLLSASFVNLRAAVEQQRIFHMVLKIETFLAYPPSQIPDSFSIDQIEERIDAANRAKAAAQKK